MRCPFSFFLSSLHRATLSLERRMSAKERLVENVDSREKHRKKLIYFE